MKKALLTIYVPLIAVMLAMAFGPPWLDRAIFMTFAACLFAWIVVGVVTVLIIGIKDFREGRVTLADLLVGILFGWIAAPLLVRELLSKR
ncbi:hypothetical protein [Paraburkholderia sp. HD33-4]|uniref:hypothetical protein n=1 Tax=Paraburkholderia sp. HD33-4 TaxID=2883242 RepID=UPI001F1E523A|nr:hypothetical protein [Paraburkholderia sp. HD33-4]